MVNYLTTGDIMLLKQTKTLTKRELTTVIPGLLLIIKCLYERKTYKLIRVQSARNNTVGYINAASDSHRHVRCKDERNKHDLGYPRTELNVLLCTSEELSAYG